MSISVLAERLRDALGKLGRSTSSVGSLGIAALVDAEAVQPPNRDEGSRPRDAAESPARAEQAEILLEHLRRDLAERDPRSRKELLVARAGRAGTTMIEFAARPRSIAR